MENPEAIQIFLVAAIAFFYSTGISWVEEQSQWFGNLSSQWKQRVNAVLTLIVPAVAQWLTPYWRPEFGDPAEVTTNLFYVLIPIGFWLWSQVAHLVNPITLRKKLISGKIPTFTTSYSSSPEEPLHIETSGNVGIGTDTPING